MGAAQPASLQLREQALQLLEEVFASGFEDPTRAALGEALPVSHEFASHGGHGFSPESIVPLNMLQVRLHF